MLILAGVIDLRALMIGAIIAIVGGLMAAAVSLLIVAAEMAPKQPPP